MNPISAVSVGSSGAIFGLLGAYVTHRWLQRDCAPIQEDEITWLVQASQGHAAFLSDLPHAGQVLLLFLQFCCAALCYAMPYRGWGRQAHGKRSWGRQCVSVSEYCSHPKPTPVGQLGVQVFGINFFLTYLANVDSWGHIGGMLGGAAFVMALGRGGGSRSW